MPIKQLYSTALFAFLFLIGFSGTTKAQNWQSRNASAAGQTLFAPTASSTQPYAAMTCDTLTLLPAFEGGKVVLDFHRWAVSCPDDYIYVYDGPSTESPVLGIYSCLAPASIEASPFNTTGALTLVFVSDALFQGMGFEATARTACRLELEHLNPIAPGFLSPDSLKVRFPYAGKVRWETSADGTNYSLFTLQSAENLLSVPPNKGFRWVRARFDDCPTGGVIYSKRLAVRSINSQSNKSTEESTFAAGCPNCPDRLQASSDLTIVCENSCTFLNAEGIFITTVNDNFNSGIDFSLWANVNGTTTQGCGSLDGSPTLWFGNDALPRIAETISLDTRNACSMSFDFRNGTGIDPDPTGCEDGEKASENPLLQYFDGNGWVNMQVFDNGGANAPGPFGSWRNLCVDLPGGARTQGTRFRWVQFEHDLTGFDQWAIDNVSIDVRAPNVTYQWTGPNILSGANTNRPVVCPTASTTYTVTATDGTDVLTETVFIEVLTSAEIAGRVLGAKSICPGGATGVLTLIDYSGDVINWEQSVGCTGAWELVFVQSPTFSQSNVSETTCFRAIVKFGECRGPSEAVRIEVPRPISGVIVPDQVVVECEDQPINYTLQGHFGNIIGWYQLLPPTIRYIPGSEGMESINFKAFCGVFAIIQLPGCPDSTQVRTPEVCVEFETNPPPYPQQATIIVQHRYDPECTQQDPLVAVIQNISPDRVEYWEILMPGSFGWERLVGSEGQLSIISDTVLGKGTCFRAIVELDTSANECDTIRTVQPPIQCVDQLPCPNCPIPDSVQLCFEDPEVTFCHNDFACDSLVFWQFVITEPDLLCSRTELVYQNIPLPPAELCIKSNVPPGKKGCYRHIRAVGGDMSRLVISLSHTVYRFPEIPQGTLAAFPPTGCANANGGQFEISGIDPPNFIQRWEYAEASTPTNWQIIVNATGVQTYANLAESRNYRVRLYRLILPDKEDSCFAYSDTITMEVAPESIAGILTGNLPVCVGQPAGFLSLRNQIGRVQRWEISENNCNGPWRLLTNASITDFRPGLIPNSRCYRVVVKSGDCQERTTPPALVEILQPPVGGFVAGEKTICLGEDGPTLYVEGSNGQVVRWESSLDCNAGPWTKVADTTATYGVPPLNQSTCFRAYVSNSGCESLATRAQVSVLPQTIAGRIFGITKVCVGTPVDLILTESRGTVKAWEWTIDNGDNWNSINLQDVEYSTPPLTQDICYRGVFQSGTCPIAYSDLNCIDVEQLPNASLGNDTSVCEEQTVGTIELNDPSGIIRQWETDANCTNNWLTILGSAGTTTQNFGIPVQPFCLRVLIGGTLCPDTYTNSKRIGIDLATVGGNLRPVAPICAGESPVTQLENQIGSALGWDQRTIGGSWQEIPNSVGESTYPGGPLFQTTDFRVRVQNGPCLAEITPVIRVDVVQPPTPGTIDGGGTVCAGRQGPLLGLQGSAGTFVRWESAPSTCNSPSFTAFATSTVLDPGIIDFPRCFRAVVSGDAPCTEVYSDSVLIDVHPQGIGGTVLGDLEVCASSISPDLELTGHSGNILRWQVSPDSGRTWIDIAHTAAQYTPPPIDRAFWYRAQVQVADCDPEWSEPAKVNLKSETIGGEVIGGHTVCRGQPAGPLQLVNNRGNILGWEMSKDDQQSWIPLGKAGVDSLHTGRLTVTSWFRAIVQNDGCSVQLSEPVEIPVRPNEHSGVLIGGREICGVNAAEMLTLAGSQRTIEVWESKNSEHNEWQAIPLTSSIYLTGLLDKSTSYRVRFTQNNCASSNYSNEVQIVLNLPAIGGSVDSDHSVCRGTPSNWLNIKGFRGTISHWEATKDDGLSWFSVGKPDATSYRSGRMTVRMGYRAMVQSIGCANKYSVPAWVDIAAVVRPGIVLPQENLACGQLQTTISVIGGEGTLKHWQKSNDGINWLSLAESERNLLTEVLTDTTWYRLVYHTNACSRDSSTQAVQISVAEPPIAGQTGFPSTICRGSAGAPLKV